MMFNITFSPDGWADYLYWQTEDKKTLKRINRLLKGLQREDNGMGKPEILKHIKAMSLRIDEKNRLIYYIDENNLIVLSCRGHYED